MNRNSILRIATVLGAGATVLALAGSLALRAAGRSDSPGERRVAVSPKGPVAPVSGVVPEPRPLTLADVPQPLCWSCPGNAFVAADFQLDLDTLAPLGDGGSNAALWLRRFARADGDRFQENYREGAIEAEIAGRTKKVLPDGHPLLAEAEPWLDQANCSFYPEVWQLDGPDTPIPNLIVAMDLARSFVARGLAAEEPELANRDFRRAIRLGRLLRQDDATVIQDLIGIECIRLGAWAMNQQAREQGNLLVVAATNSILAESDSLRARTAMRVQTATRIYNGVRKGLFGGLSLELSDNDVAEVGRMAFRSAERRFRLEGLVALRAVYQLGDKAHRELIEDGLKELAASDDEHLSRLANLALEQPFSDAELGMLEAMGQDK